MPHVNATASLARMAVIAAALGLASCGQPADDGDDAQEQPIPVEPDGGIGDGAPPLDPVEPGTIPVALRGDWGMNVADCEGGATAKGLLEIDADTLTFYESVGTLGDTTMAEPDMIQGVFAFEGEGMEWTREMRLETAENGAVLARQELGEGASAQNFEYRRCD